MAVNAFSNYYFSGLNTFNQQLSKSKAVGNLNEKHRAGPGQQSHAQMNTSKLYAPNNSKIPGAQFEYAQVRLYLLSKLPYKGRVQCSQNANVNSGANQDEIAYI